MRDSPSGKALEFDSSIGGSIPSSLANIKTTRSNSMEKTKKYWDNKYEKETVIYGGRTLKLVNRTINVDVRNFITANDALLLEIIEKNDLRKETFNETALACQKFVVNYLDYVTDTEQDDCVEFWQFPFETIASRMGDCEDGAILMASLMINAGIPNWRVKVVAGEVQPEPTAPFGGHAYCIYLADRKDGSLEWEIHDWCYYEDTDIPTGEKPLAKDGGYEGSYKDIWFTFNNEYSWSKELATVENRVRK